MRQSHTTVLERDVVWAGAFETEPLRGGVGIGGHLLRPAYWSRAGRSKRRRRESRFRRTECGGATRGRASD